MYYNAFQAALEQEKKDVEEQRNKLYRKLEALSAQGIDIGPNMTVIGRVGKTRFFLTSPMVFLY